MESSSAVPESSLNPKSVVPANQSQQWPQDAQQTQRQEALRRLREAKRPEQLVDRQKSAHPESEQTSTELRALRSEILQDLKQDETIVIEPNLRGRIQGLKRKIAIALDRDNATVQELSSAPLIAHAKRIKTYINLKFVLRLLLLTVLVLAVFLTGFLLSYRPAAKQVLPASVDQAGTNETSGVTSGDTELREKLLQQLRPTDSAPLQPASPQEALQTILALAGDRPDEITLQHTLQRLRQMAQTARELPELQAALQLYGNLADSRALAAVEELRREALTLAGKQLFTEARKKLKNAQSAIPAYAPWHGEGSQQLQEELQALDDLRERVRYDAGAKIRNEIEAQRFSAASRAIGNLAQHPEADFQSLADELFQLLAQAEVHAKRRLEELRRAAQEAWPEFFKQFDRLILEWEFNKAAALCLPDEDVLLHGGPKQPEATLEGFRVEAQQLQRMKQALREAIEIESGRQTPATVTIGRTLGQVGRYEDELLILRLRGSAEVKIPFKRLSWLECQRILGPGFSKTHEASLWTLGFMQHAEPGEKAAQWLSQQYLRAEKTLPLHWQQRLDFELGTALKEKLQGPLAQLRLAQATSDPKAMREALKKIREMQPDTAALPLTAEDRTLLQLAEAQAGKAQLKNLVFQNNVAPSTDFTGIRIDQINKYERNKERTDVGIQFGLKVGSYNDLQRILIRFEGLESELGKVRIKKATLELYQTQAPQADGATVGLFRLKKDWSPGAGTWIHADQRKRVTWEKPGASGPEDTHPFPDAEVTFDTRKDLWRSWDVTHYVKDTIEGKVQNYGLLIRIFKNEPNYHLRFYPNTSLEAQNTPNLRPRLIVEAEVFE